MQNCACLRSGPARHAARSLQASSAVQTRKAAPNSPSRIHAEHAEHAEHAIAEFARTLAARSMRGERLSSDIAERRIHRGHLINMAELRLASELHSAVHDAQSKPFIGAAWAKDILATVTRTKADFTPAA